MFYIPQSDTTLVSLEVFRAMNPDTSFGDLSTKEDLDALGIFQLYDERPYFDRELQDLKNLGIQLIDSKYKYVYEVTDKELNSEERMQIMLPRFDAALSYHLDSVAIQRKYDNRVTCALRAGYPGPFQAEGLVFAAWMDACNWKAYQTLDAVKSGTIPAPTIEEFIASLPIIEWP